MLQALLQRRLQLQLLRQFVQVGTLHEALLIGHQQAGQVHLARHLGRGGGAGHFGRVERLGQFGVQPVLHVGRQALARQLALDQPALARVDVPVGLGGGHDGLQDGGAVRAGLRGGQAVHRLRRGQRGRLCRRQARGAGLLALVFGVGVVDHHAQRRQTAVAGQLARLLVLAQQQPQRAARERAAPEVAVDRPANAAAAVGLVGASDGGAGGFQKVVEEAGEVVHGAKTVK